MSDLNVSRATKKTKIEWAFETWNVTGGCTRVSPGCDKCYALKFSNRLQAANIDLYKNTVQKIDNSFLDWSGKINKVVHDYSSIWYDDFEELNYNNFLKYEPNISLNDFPLYQYTEVRYHKILFKPFLIKTPSIIFINSMSDLFHEKIDNSFIKGIMNIVNMNKRHVFILCTKRTDRMRYFFNHVSHAPDNLIGLTTVESQNIANERIPIILNTELPYIGLSIEPMLEPINISGSILKNFDWIIIGAETGPGKRYCNHKWIQSLVNSCLEYDVRVFVKKLHSQDYPNKITVISDIEEFPKSLRLRQYPDLIHSKIFNIKK